MHDGIDGQNQAAAEGEDDIEASGDQQEGYETGDANGGYSNMFSGSGDFNQMQMMMAMQNGMGPNSFGGFPMMGK